MSAHDQRQVAGAGVGSPADPGPGDPDADTPHSVGAPADDHDGGAPPAADSDVVQAVAAFVDDLVDEPDCP